MPEEVTSRHLRGATELMLVVPVKPGFVDVDGQTQRVSYALRLRALLDGLFDFIRQDVEQGAVPGSGPIDRLRSIFSTQWAVLDAVQPPQLLVAAVFDRSWEDYVRILVEQTGALLDAIFCHCVGFEKRTCNDGFTAFASFLREHQVRCDFFFTATPDLTVDDFRYLKELSKSRDAKGGKVDPASVIIPPFDGAAAGAAVGSDRMAQVGRLEAWFPDKWEIPGDSRTAKKIFAAAAAQLSAPEAPKGQQCEPETLTEADRCSIQGNILTPYPRMSNGCILLVACGTPKVAASLLQALSTRVTTEATAQSNDPRVNVALTYAGLGRFGLSEGTLALFPKEFREGMVERAGLLGDIGKSNHPSTWSQPGVNWPAGTADDGLIPPGSPLLAKVDLVVTLQWRDDTSPEVHIENLQALFAPGVRILHLQPLERRIFEGNNNYREHFGFLDSGDPASGSQPVPHVGVEGGGPLVSNAAARDLVALGELLLGYTDRDGKVASFADEQKVGETAKLFRNGSFLVMRKLEQNVEEFTKYTSNTGLAPADDIKALIVGRTLAQGTPLVLVEKPPPNPPNDFDYTSDDKGAKCPFHAHIRRANPRDRDARGRALTPRIMRRGFSYGKPYKTQLAGSALSFGQAFYAKSDTERGLVFMAYNASIAEQFEVIQRWINGGNSTGVSSAQNDLLVSPLENPQITRWVKIDGVSQPLPQPDAPFVKLKWGIYLFVPSVEAMRVLARTIDPEPTGVQTEGSVVENGRRLVAQLREVEQKDAAMARAAWRLVLEGRDLENRVKARAIWAAIREDGGTRQTPYGFLVATASGAQKVLSDKGKIFSVRKYWQRLVDTIGEHYLGLDLKVGHVNDTKADDLDNRYEARLRRVTYAQEATRPDAYIEQLNDGAYTLTPRKPAANGQAYATALRRARETFEHWVKSGLGGAAPGRPIIDIKFLATAVAGRLAQDWIGLPLPLDCSDLDLAAFLQNFIVVSEYSFQPYPEAQLAQLARACGGALRDAYAAVRPLQSPMANFLREKGETSEERIEEAVVGAIVGFAAPGVGSIIDTITQWMNRGLLSYMADLCASKSSDGERQRTIFPEVIKALELTPVPPILYRKALKGAEVDGVGIDEGQLVVVSLQSAVADTRMRNESDPQPWRWLFGGEHGGGKGDEPPHGCPARPAALDVITGVVTAILERTNLRREGPTAVSFDA